MTAARDHLVRDAAARGKYASLYRHLLSTQCEPEWRTTFGEIEAVLGFRLPNSARLYRPWWSNSKHGSGHSHALAWQAAGWRTREVDIETETLVFARTTGVEARPGKVVRKRDFNLDRDFPPWDPGPWPEGFTVSREQIYDDRGRLAGGSEDDSGGDGR